MQTWVCGFGGFEVVAYTAELRVHEDGVGDDSVGYCGWCGGWWCCEVVFAEDAEVLCVLSGAWSLAENRIGGKGWYNGCVGG